MILKAPSKPESLLRLQRLVIRSHDPSPYLQDLRNREQGYKYESELSFYLDRILHLFHPIPIIILHDVRIPIANSSIQIDCLLLTPYFGLIIEVKGTSGKMSFSQNAHFFHYDKGEISNPITQAEEQRDQLQHLLKMNDYPIEYVVSLGHPNVFVDTDESSDWVRDVVIPFNMLKNHMKRLIQKHTYDYLSKQQLMELGYRLLAKHRTERKFYHMDPSSIEYGVICPSCNRLKMIRLKFKWQCPHCGAESDDAHYQDLMDWFSFMNYERITNRDCRSFLQLSNSSTSFNILRNCSFLEVRGKNRGAHYVRRI